MIRPRVIVSRAMEAALVVVGLAVLWAGDPNDWLAVWDVLAAVYVVIWAVETRHRDVRAQVLVHSVLGFFYNAAVIGVAVGVVTGGR
ncbi:hypothetical protein [Nocardia veterana]|uniref:Uncharacterized protein n=1 Tax=Nocardia veterana TaxID=132249 RepID=A0A7X6M0B2_9NOCA|nr:hypothetical protein [Nocardia veterana]NKY87866.1 hypothetical protein [Nocardia veterana]